MGLVVVCFFCCGCSYLGFLGGFDRFSKFLFPCFLWFSICMFVFCSVSWLPMNVLSFYFQ